MTALVYTIIEAPNHGWTSGRTIAGFAVAAVVIAAFIWWEQRQTHPMLDLSVFRNRRFSGGSLAITAGFLTLFGFIFVITQYFQFIKGYGAFETGVRLLPVAASIAIASIVGPRIVERIGTTVVVAGGLAIFAAGLGWASTASASTPYLEIAVQMVLLGAGLGLTTAPGTESIMGSLSADKAGVGSAVNDTTRELGGTLGVAIVGSVFASIYSGRLADAPAIQALPEETRAVMGESMAAAQQVIAQVPPAAAPAIRNAVETAFLDGQWIGSLVAAGIALAAAVVVAVDAARPGTPNSNHRHRNRSSTNQRRSAHEHLHRHLDRRPRHSPVLHPIRRLAPAVLHRRHRPRAGADAHDPHPAGLLPPGHPAAVGLVHRLCAGSARHGLVGHRARRANTRSRSCVPRWSSSSPDSTCTTSRWPGNRSAARSRCRPPSTSRTG